jgi:hypothetical protein
MLTLVLGLALGLLTSRTGLATKVYTAAANRLTFLPRP